MTANTSLPERGVIELEGVDPEALADGLRAEGRRVFVLAGRDHRQAQLLRGGP